MKMHRNRVIFLLDILDSLFLIGNITCILRMPISVVVKCSGSTVGSAGVCWLGTNMVSPVVRKPLARSLFVSSVY